MRYANLLGSTIDFDVAYLLVLQVPQLFRDPVSEQRGPVRHLLRQKHHQVVQPGGGGGGRGRRGRPRGGRGGRGASGGAFASGSLVNVLLLYTLSSIVHCVFSPQFSSPGGKKRRKKNKKKCRRPHRHEQDEREFLLLRGEGGGGRGSSFSSSLSESLSSSPPSSPERVGGQGGEGGRKGGRGRLQSRRGGSPKRRRRRRRSREFSSDSDSVDSSPESYRRMRTMCKVLYRNKKGEGATSQTPTPPSAQQGSSQQ